MPDVGSSDVLPPGHGRLVGRIEFIWGNSCSVKAICLCAGHAGCAAKSVESGKKRRRECFLLLHAALDPFGRWEDCARWLTMGRDGEEHAAQNRRDAEDIRQHCKGAKPAKAKPKAVASSSKKSPKVPKESTTK